MRVKPLPRLLANTLGLAVALVSLFPLVWMALAGFKSESEVLSLPFRLLPSTWMTSNYTDLLFQRVDQKLFPAGASFLGSILMTAGVSGFSLILSLLVNSMAGYAFARLRFPMKRLLWVLYLTPWFVPGISMYVSSFMVVYRLGMIDSFWVLTLPGICYTYAIFFYRQYYLNVPASLEEAALLDGATRMGVYLRIFLPMSGTPFVVMGISVFLGYWGSFLWPVMTVANPKLFQINQLISFFKASYRNQQQLVMAASTIAAIPTILLFLVFQRFIMQGIKVSGIK